MLVFRHRNSACPASRFWLFSRLFLCCLLTAVTAPFVWGAQAASTAVSLGASSTTVPTGTVVTLTATVSSGAGTSVGQVNFCDAARVPIVRTDASAGVVTEVRHVAVQQAHGG